MSNDAMMIVLNIIVFTGGLASGINIGLMMRYRPIDDLLLRAKKHLAECERLAGQTEGERK